jgi:hypothetical protein
MYRGSENLVDWDDAEEKLGSWSRRFHDRHAKSVSDLVFIPDLERLKLDMPGSATQQGEQQGSCQASA